MCDFYDQETAKDLQELRDSYYNGDYDSEEEKIYLEEILFSSTLDD